jgi:acetylornithine deacetylase
MSKAIQAFSDYNEALLQAEPHPLCGHGRFTPSVIKGGTILSTVPDQCELEVDRRVLPGETKDKVFEEYRSRLDPLVKDSPTFGYEITEPTWDIPANDISEQEPVVQSLLSAYQVVMGKPTQCKAFAAATDAPNMGFPTVVCGPGSIDQAHGKNEFVSVEQIVQAVRMYLWSILHLLL